MESITPEPLSAPDDMPPAYDDGCQVGQESDDVTMCEFGDPDGGLTIARVGDSKALQWITALDSIGRANGWRVVTFTKSTCSFTDAVLSREGASFRSCTDWNDAVTDRLHDLRPALVLTSQGRNQALDDPDDAAAGESAGAMASGLVRRWRVLEEYGINVAVLADTPQPGQDVYECVAENPDRLTACAFDRATAISGSAAEVQRRAVDELRGVAWIDLNGAICPADSCVPVIGNVLVYRQGSHLTVTYVDTLAPRLARALEEIIG